MSKSRFRKSTLIFWLNSLSSEETKDNNHDFIRQTHESLPSKQKSLQSNEHVIFRTEWLTFHFWDSSNNLKLICDFLLSCLRVQSLLPGYTLYFNVFVAHYAKFIPFVIVDTNLPSIG